MLVSNIKLGKISLFRWITFASRVLRVYISQEYPSENLLILATYAVKVYAITWFEAKWDPRLDHGPLHLLHKVQRQNMYFSGNVLNTSHK